jgi:hypothetical protein
MNSTFGIMARQQAQNRPKPPFPPQGISPPGLEAEMDPRPQYKAPEYRPAGKLQDRVAIVTGAIRALAAQWL